MSVLLHAEQQEHAEEQQEEQEVHEELLALVLRALLVVATSACAGHGASWDGICCSCSLNLGVPSRYLAGKQCLDRGDHGLVVTAFCVLDCGLPCRWRQVRLG